MAEKQVVGAMRTLAVAMTRRRTLRGLGAIAVSGLGGWAPPDTKARRRKRNPRSVTAAAERYQRSDCIPLGSNARVCFAAIGVVQRTTTPSGNELVIDNGDIDIEYFFDATPDHPERYVQTASQRYHFQTLLKRGAEQIAHNRWRETATMWDGSPCTWTFNVVVTKAEVRHYADSGVCGNEGA